MTQMEKDTSTEIEQNETVYRKVMLQISVLETLRIYLDPSPELLKDLWNNNILTEDELNVLQKLPWPTNRNQLLHTLIKKSWKEKEFTAFCNVLNKTEKFEKLSEMLQSKVTKIVEQSETYESNRNRPLSREYESLVSGPLRKINPQERTDILRQLKEKDDEIRILKTENETLREELKHTTTKLHNTAHKLKVLEESVSHTLAHTDLDDHSLEEGVNSLQIRLTDANKELNKVKAELHQSHKEKDKFKAEAKQFEEDLKSTKRLLMQTEDTMKDSHYKLQNRTFQLQTKVDHQKETINILQNKLEESERTKALTKTALEQDARDLRDKLNAVISSLTDTERERDSMKTELEDVQDKTRKLLTTLNIRGKHTSNISLAVDHARNLSYAKGRRGSLIPMDSNQSSRRGSTPCANSDPLPSTPDSLATDKSAAGLIIQKLQKVDRSSCARCGKQYDENSNFEGACLKHEEGATLINEGTSLAVWSCCKSVTTMKGCIKGKHSCE
ncbi:DgyrCDS9894 [Dimorphilus gyrociliatus]|uniref:DgyrCDS9894 n=1 Tax=Dimorphilus gyrociliatus TaxID=2664684 RepID=A0A7I8W0K6_9ANNE|nr:DgyrCDS9894 [Dimorphilus gyrociliatus]